jgi:hypothetical protein
MVGWIVGWLDVWLDGCWDGWIWHWVVSMFRCKKITGYDAVVSSMNFSPSLFGDTVATVEY